MNDPIKLFDVVALLEDLPEDNLYRGHVGTVIEVYTPDAFEVEFSDLNGITYGMTVLRVDQLMVLHHAPIHEE